jgi:prepilin-type N-terminal cleavage/methylation domain-containing protein
MKLQNKYAQLGFSLVEMAIVLVILGFVLSALLLPLQAQRQQIAQSQTEKTLEIAKQALGDCLAPQLRPMVQNHR